MNEDDKKILSRHVTNLDKDVYLIQNLPPEVVAVLFAFVSRSPASFRDNLLRLIKQKDLDMGDMIGFYEKQGMDYGSAKKKASDFHEKWVVGYGHSSVAEHAMASIALENVSILASKVIEDNRLASYTEKSTRYQVFDRNRYYKPKNLMNSALGKLYEDTCNFLFDTYVRFLPIVMDFVRKKHPKKEDQGDRLYESLSNARACDIIRYILPSSTLTNIGMTINARALAHAIRKMLSHPLVEMQDLAAQMRDESTKIMPVLVRHADPNPFLIETNKVMEKNVKEMFGDAQISDSEPVVLVDYDKEADDKLVASILYRYSKYPHAQIKEIVADMSREEKEKIFDEFMQRMTKHDWPMRELEHVNYTTDILMDYGAFRDIQRHRIATQTNQDVTVEHGYSTPPEIEEIGIKKEYDDCMQKAVYAFHKIAEVFPKEAQYVVPLAFKKRVLFTWNLRELHHFIKIRSTRHGHISYRIIAHKLYEAVKKVHPLLAKYITCDTSLEHYENR